MTFYDDAEFAAIKVTRLAASEYETDDPKSAEILSVVADMFERHGNAGVTALVAALARHNASALRVVAGHQGKDIATVIDNFERHKLEQIYDEDEDD